LVINIVRMIAEDGKVNSSATTLFDRTSTVLDADVRGEAWTFNFGASEKSGRGFLPN
jgi:hypothetical protein